MSRAACASKDCRGIPRLSTNGFGAAVERCPECRYEGVPRNTADPLDTPAMRYRGQHRNPDAIRKGRLAKVTPARQAEISRMGVEAKRAKKRPGLPPISVGNYPNQREP